MRIDLHVHSTCSDGLRPPEEVVRAAREAGLDIIALTDHDTTSGVAAAREAGRSLGVDVVTGCEVSANYAGSPVHVLAYFFDPEHSRLSEELRLIRESRLDRARRVVERLRELGVAITYERVREIAQGDSVARPHIARAMVEAGVVASVGDAFTDEWIGNGGRAYIEKRALDPVEAVELIVEAGGTAVIAHPIWTRDRMPEEIIERMVAAGMGGIEVDHPDQDVEARAHYRALAQRLGVVATGSSDWHGGEHGGVIGSETTHPDAFRDLRARAASVGR